MDAIVGSPSKKRGYNSHGFWSTLGKIRKLETDRGNDFPEFLSAFSDDTPAIWLCLVKRKALRYAVSADDWERVNDEDIPLTDEELEKLSEMVEIPLVDGMKLVHEDPDDGFLIIDLRVKPHLPRN